MTPGSARPKNAAASLATPATAATSTPVVAPMRCSRCARSSVQTLPAATAVNGQPPRPPNADSNARDAGAERRVRVGQPEPVRVVEMAGHRQPVIRAPGRRRTERFDLRRIRVTGRVGEADGRQPRVKEAPREIEHALRRHGPFEAAAEGRLHRHLDALAGRRRRPSHRDDAAGRPRRCSSRCSSGCASRWPRRPCRSSRRRRRGRARGRARSARGPM